MNASKKMLIFAFIIASLIMESNQLIAQEKFSILIGKVVGIRGR